MYKRLPGESMNNIYTSLNDSDRTKSANPNVYFYRATNYQYPGYIYWTVIFLSSVWLVDLNKDIVETGGTFNFNRMFHIWNYMLHSEHHGTRREAQ